MGGVIGATSGKFIIAASALLLQGRIDHQRASIAIAPEATTSAIAPALAARLGGDGPIRINIGAEALRTARPPVEPRPYADADMRIGQDVLSVDPIELDVRRHQAHILLPGEARRAESRMTAYPLARQADGTLRVGRVPGAPPPCPANSSSENADGGESIARLFACSHAKLIFDPGHALLWIG